MNFLLLISLLSLLCTRSSTLLSHIYRDTPVNVVDASDPKIITPVADTVWQAGNRQYIEWNTSFTQTGKKYYNNFTRISIALYDAKSKKEVARAIDNFPFMLGSIYWNVPTQGQVSGWFGKKKNVTIGSESGKGYFLMIYPSYFDWSGACPGCKKSAPKGDPFTILPLNCTQPACQSQLPSVDDSGQYLPGEASQRDYLMAMQLVGIGVGTVAVLGFLVALLIYTKQGKKTWQKYRRKRSGMLYKYRPPVTEQKPPSPPMKAKSETPLGNFFSETEDGKERNRYSVNSSSSASSSSTHIGPADIGGSRLSMFESASATDLADINYSQQQQQQHHHQQFGSVDLSEPPKAHYKGPSRPPRPFPPSSGGASARVSFIIPEETEAFSANFIDNISDIVSGPQSSTSSPSPMINAVDATLVADTFRNTLRMNAEQGTSEIMSDSEESSSSPTSPTTGYVEDLSTSYERDHLKFMKKMSSELKDEMEQVESGCSPLLSKLDKVDESISNVEN